MAVNNEGFRMIESVMLPWAGLLERLTRECRRRLHNSQLREEMVWDLRETKAEELLSQCRSKLP
jgi:hypothetical protein